MFVNIIYNEPSLLDKFINIGNTSVDESEFIKEVSKIYKNNLKGNNNDKNKK